MMNTESQLDPIQLAECLLSKVRNDGHDFSIENIRLLHGIVSSIAAAVGSLCNLTLPISRLPAEILGLIFDNVPSTLHTIAESDSSRPSYCKRISELTAITHVCRHWRSVALDQPSLWTSIYNLGSTYDLRDEQWAHLKRSRQAPLHIYNRFTEGNFLQTVMTSHGHQAKTLVVEVPYYTPAEIRPMDYLDIPALDLERLALFDFRSVDHQPSSSHSPFFQGVTPQLRSLTLNGADFTRSLPSIQFDNLVHLEISDALQCHWTSADMITLLGLCPVLQELILAKIDAVHDSRPVERITLPRLIRLVLTDLRPEFASDILSHLDLPANPMGVSISAITEDSSDYSFGMANDPSVLKALARLDIVAGKGRFVGLDVNVLYPTVYLIGSLSLTAPSTGSFLSIQLSRSSPPDWLSSIFSSLPESAWTGIESLQIIDSTFALPDVSLPESPYTYVEQFVRSIRSSLLEIILVADVHEVMQHWLRVISADPSAFPRLAEIVVNLECYDTSAVPVLVQTLLDLASARAAHVGRPMKELCIKFDAALDPEMRAELAKLESLKAADSESSSVETVNVLSSWKPLESWVRTVYTPSAFWPCDWRVSQN